MKLTINHGTDMARCLSPGYVMNWLPFTSEFDGDLWDAIATAQVGEDEARAAYRALVIPKNATREEWAAYLAEAKRLGTEEHAAYAEVSAARRAWSDDVVKGIIRV